MGLKTNVFHYIVALNAKKRKVRAQSATNSEAEIPMEGPDERSGETSIGHNIIEIEDSRSPLPFMLKIEQKGIKVPILLLVISIMALVFSILFYCERSASSDLMTCLPELIAF